MKFNSLKNIIRHVACWILLLQMINISIDPPDLKLPGNTQAKIKEPAIDETETVYELIAEDFFEHQVPENDDEETDTSSPSFLLYFFSGSITKIPVLFFPAEHFSHSHKKVLSAHQEPAFPPPRIM